MDADAFPVGHLVDEGQEFFEFRRVGLDQGVGAGRDEVVCVLEGWDGDVSIGFFAADG